MLFDYVSSKRVVLFAQPAMQTEDGVVPWKIGRAHV
jgi:hypothetical protein